MSFQPPGQPPGSGGPFIKAFAYALAGIKDTFKTERNFKIQLALGALAVGAGWYVKLLLWQWALLAAAIFFVLVAELFNTAIEATIDLICQDKPHPLAKKAKDAAAGAVLLAAIFAILAGLVIGIHLITHT